MTDDKIIKLISLRFGFKTKDASEELKDWDMLIKPFSGNLDHYTFNDGELLNQAQIIKTQIVLAEYDSENYLFENNEKSPVYALTIFEKSCLESNDK